MDNDNETKVRRERIATAVLAGSFSGRGGIPDRTNIRLQMAIDAVWMADALIAELDKEPSR